ncbi:unnamed protein product [Schistosoma mattheei]|uniref:Uncharacterized protein n=1 Tax=Schistosoma mattheei TaxID=31246 RepID=A0A183PP31_9TREM|nr:unnamed protein product [Schistosoma mattheei]
MGDRLQAVVPLALQSRSQVIKTTPTSISFSDGILTMTQDVKNTEYVFLIFTCSYRFGRDDLDVLGLTFQKELLIYTKCLWPNHPFDDNNNTKVNKKWNNTWKKIKRLSKRKINSNEQISCTIINDNDPYGIFCETLKENNLSPFQVKLINKHGDLAFPFRIIVSYNDLELIIL